MYLNVQISLLLFNLNNHMSIYFLYNKTYSNNRKFNKFVFRLHKTSNKF